MRFKKTGENARNATVRQKNSDTKVEYKDTDVSSASRFFNLHGEREGS